MTRSKSLLVCAVAIAGSAALAQPVLAAEMSPELAAVAKAADTEGSMKVVLVAGTLGGGPGFRKIQDGMNKMFGTKVEIKFAPGGSMPQVGNQIAAEHKAGRPATSDVYLTSLNNAANFIEMGLFRSAPWSKLLPGRITDEMVEADGTAVRFTTTLTDIVYNKNLVPNPPKTLAGWLAPEFKGKLASTPFAAGFEAMGANDVWGPEKTIKYAEALSGQLSGLISCADSHRVASGEFAAMIFNCGGTAEVMKEKGAPIDMLIPEDYTSQGFSYMLVPKNAASPNAAILLITYMLTSEGQRMVWEHDKGDLYLFPDSKSRPEVLEAMGRAQKVVVQTIDWAHAHPEKKEAAREVTKLLTRKQ
jgi:ABC-type Fe3+ transport system substrate-binding protein